VGTVYLKLRCYCRKFLEREDEDGDGDGDGGGGGERGWNVVGGDVCRIVDCERMNLILGVGRDERGG